jgi:L-cystine transport system ATP-binding protein
VTIIGSSGSGKTTFLRCISSLSRADAGSVRINNDEYILGKMGRSEVAAYRKRIGFVFQDYQLFANKTVLENVMLGLVVGRGIDRAVARERAIEALKRVDMLDRTDYYPSKLSGGQQQRVSIARAMALGPDVIMFDEPTSALDPQLTREVLDTIKRLKDDGITMIIVTHELEFARKVSDRTVFMDGGLVVEEADSESFFTSPKDARTKDFIRGDR